MRATGFSHASKVELVTPLLDAGCRVHLHAVIVPVELAVARVSNRVDNGGHSVAEHKVRERFFRLWPLVAGSIRIVQETTVYDNSCAAHPHRVVAKFIAGRSFGDTHWPSWAPPELVALTG